MRPTNADLASRVDIERLIDSFYARVRVDATLGPIFDDVAHTDWATHLPRMYEFWSTVLFNAGSFQGRPLDVHLALARRVHLGPGEFGRWLALFDATVDDAFHGPGADDIKARARRIAAVMQHHISADQSSGQRA